LRAVQEFLGQADPKNPALFIPVKVG